jgi:rhamnosyltransferase
MNINSGTVSIVTRTKNEEQHLEAFFQAISKQSIAPLEVIVVDNDSSDRSKEICEAWGAKVIHTVDYLPGKALNLGISKATADHIAIISSHCIPANRDWLKNLCVPLEKDGIAGAYGRQVPTEKSKPNDIRDLLTTFPNESRIQFTDPFFHNANSVVRRQIWEKYPFDNEVTNIEDRVWAKLVIERGFQLAYNPEAIVFHEHGINHDGDKDRAFKISKVLAVQNLYPINEIENWFYERP